MTKQELNKKLREINEKKITNGNGFIVQGTNKVGKDILPLLQDGEEIVDFCDARISSLFKFFKGSRYARCYMVITTRRIIYIERGNMIMSLNPLANKTILIDRVGMSGDLVENSGIEKLVYPYLLQIRSNSGQYQISVKDDVRPYLQTGNAAGTMMQKGGTTDPVVQVGNTAQSMTQAKTEQKAPRVFPQETKTPSHRFCRYCGKELKADWMQCPYCGK